VPTARTRGVVVRHRGDLDNDGVDRAETSRIAHAHHPVAAPLSDASVARLLERLDPAEGTRVVDLGCGSGAWLVELLARRPDLTALGIDTHLHPDRVARAASRGVGDRLTWFEGDAGDWWDGGYGAVLCIGASHAFGGTAGMLDAVATHLRPGGRALVGDAFWESPPSAATQAALDATPADFPTLAGFVDLVAEHGWAIVHAHVSTSGEWDEYEWSWTGSLTDWALHEATDPAERDEALEVADRHRRDWLEGYRGELGFVTAVLVRRP
jgi:precorrin-6B methylase 2